MANWSPLHPEIVQNNEQLEKKWGKIKVEITTMQERTKFNYYYKVEVVLLFP